MTGEDLGSCNPWVVENVEVFHFYCCPECEQKYQKCSDFQDHALSFHPKAKMLFTDESCDTTLKVEDDVSQVSLGTPWFVEETSEDALETDVDNLICLICDKKLKTLLQLAWHMNTVHSRGEDEHKCPKCDSLFISHDLLKDHISESHPKSCNICNEEVSNMSAHMRTRHLDDVSIKRFKCEICDFATHTQKNLSQHIFVRHKKDEHKYACDHCAKRFPTNFLMKQHVDITHKGQNKRHMCDKCGKAFAYKNGIKDHPCKPGHVQKDVQCDKCDHVFKREMDYLQHHKSQHGGFPPHLEHKVKFLCDQCPAAYTTYVGLYLHRRKNHSELSQDKQPKAQRQVHVCEDCGKEYNNRKNLVDHQKIKHQNILPFACEHCDKRFPSGSMMRTHIKNVHQRQKCPQCGVEISNKYWFRRHMSTAHGVKQEGALQCDFCPKMFFSTACKDRHTQTNHLNELTSQLSHQS